MEEKETEKAQGRNMMPIVIGGIVVVLLLSGFAYVASQGTSLQPKMSPVEKETNDTVKKDEVMTKEEGDDEKGEVKTFNVTGSSFKFDPSEIRVDKGDIVKIVFTNGGGTHDWTLDEFDAKTEQLSSGQTETIEFVADKAGTFEYYCSVGNHRNMGMVGKLIVK